MTDVLFYHLERQPLEHVLPLLLEKTRERGWKAVVQSTDSDRLTALDTALWTYDDQSFLPHGLASDPLGERQPIALITSHDNPNDAHVRFYVHGARAEQIDDYDRVVFLFNGHEADEMTRAREQWKTLKDAGYQATYWQQDERGRWTKKA